MFNKSKHNYNTIERETLAMVYALHKFKHFLLGNKFVFLCRPYGFSVFGQQTTCVRMDSKMVIEFIIVYKLGITHVVVDVLSKLLDNLKPLCVPYRLWMRHYFL